MGTVDATASTVTWNITATQGTVTSSDLVVDGDLVVRNDGIGAATIGNIVVNLQTRVNGHWVTQSSDIADATHDDAATSAHVVQNASTENQTTSSARTPPRASSVREQQLRHDLLAGARSDHPGA